MRGIRSCWLWALLLGSCGGGTEVTPQLIAGGGVASGPIDGVLNVFALDYHTGEAISGAAVRVGTPEDSAPLTGLTDADGLATFKDDKLKGTQVVTVSADGYAPSTWFGVAGANVTLVLGLRDPPAVDTAMISGTIDGFDSLPAPAQDHYLLAMVQYSRLPRFNAPENSIEQPRVNGRVQNVCTRMPLGSPECAWTLTTRAGKQRLYATLLDGNTNGTADTRDDTLILVGYAIGEPLDVQAGQKLANQILAPVPESSLRKAEAIFPPAPSGLSEALAAPMLDAGEDGLLAFWTPGLTPESSEVQIPQGVQGVEGGSGRLVADAHSASGETVPNSMVFRRGLDFSAAVDLERWLPVPADLTAGGGDYAFTPAAGASMHVVDFLDPVGVKAWSVAVLDTTQSFSLPPLTPDPLPSGTVTFRVGALEIPGFDPAEFTLEGVESTLDRSARNQTTFSH